MLLSRWLYYLGMTCLTYMFWWSGLTKLWDFSSARAEMLNFGLKPAALFAMATIALELGGSVVVVAGGRFAWIGAAALAAFTLATIPVAHDFWNKEGTAAFLEKAIAQEHLSVVGGLLVAAILAQWVARREDS